MQIKSIILLLTYFITFALAEKSILYDAYDAATMKRKKTSNSKYEVSVEWNVKRDSCWWTNVGGTHVGCCSKNGKVSNNILLPNSDNWNHCIDVKKGTTFTDVKMKGLTASIEVLIKSVCEKQTHKLKQDVYKERAHCISNGCLTRFGWVNSGNYKIRSC